MGSDVTFNFVWPFFGSSSRGLLQCQLAALPLVVINVFRILDRVSRRSQRGLGVYRCIYPEVAGNFFHALIFQRA